jgi:hypothetical protein
VLVIVITEHRDQTYIVITDTSLRL